MPRSRRATSAEVESALTESLSLLTDVIRSPPASAAIDRRMQQLEAELDFWEEILGLLESSTDKEFDKALTISPDLVTQASRQATLTLDDIEGFRQLFQRIAEALRGNEVAAEDSSSALLRFIRRSLTPNAPTVRRFRPEFEEAFRRRHLAGAEGESVTAEALAQALTEGEYNRNPESAVRNMQQGIRRVAREHERCSQLDISSPFIDSDPSA